MIYRLTPPIHPERKMFQAPKDAVELPIDGEVAFVRLVHQEGLRNCLTR